MSVVRSFRSVLAFAALGGALALAGSSRADDLGWSYATATAAKCFIGHCAPSEQIKLGSETHFGSNTDTSASANGGVYGGSWAGAEGGDGGLPELHAFAAANILPGAFGIDYAGVQGIAGFKNTGDSTLIIPLDAFVGELEYWMQGPAFGVGGISAALAITTDAINDPTIATQWFANNGVGGNFAATCDTPGAIALGNSAVLNFNGSSGADMAHLTVAATSCDGPTFALGKGETFYMWAKLSVVRAVAGATNAGDTFSIQFSPQASKELKQEFALNLTQVDGGNIAPSIPEPATWAMMIIGFGGIGSVLRRRGAAAVA